MKKNIYFIILTLVTLLCMGIGICRQYTKSASSGSTISKEQGMEEISSLNVKGDVMELTIKAGTGYKVTYSCSQDLEPVIRNEQGHVTITQKSKFVWFSPSSQNCKVTLELPAETLLSTLYAEVDVGNITLENIQADYAELEADTGDLTLTDCTFQTLKTEDDLGNISAKQSALGSATLNADTGNVSLTSCSFANLTAEADLGNVKIDSATDLSDYSFDAKCDLGSISIQGTKQGDTHVTNGSGPYKLVLRADTGNIQVDW